MKYTPKNLELLERWKKTGFLDNIRSKPEQLMMAKVFENRRLSCLKVKEEQGIEAYNKAFQEYKDWISELREAGFLGESKEEDEKPKR